VQDRHRGARRPPQGDPAARLVRGVRTGGQPAGGHLRAGRERWRPRTGRHRWQGRGQHRPRHHRGGTGRRKVSMLTSGQLLADRYRLARRIAVGGMGEVWEASDTRLDRLVAVKVLKPELGGDAEFLHRFRTEARTTAALNHPGIAAVHDYGETAAIPDGPEDTAYLVMELVDGEPLAAILARDGKISSAQTLDILEQAGHALQAAHERRYVHRDVKPGNIMITPSGVVKLTDFGIAKAADAAPGTRSGMVMGTAHCIAPERAV